MSELVDSLPWCVHEMDSCGEVWDPVIHKVTPHISAWDDPIGQSVMMVDALVVSGYRLIVC